MDREEQLKALTPEVVRDYAEGRIAWTQIRRRLGVTDCDLVLFRLGQDHLSIPRANPARSELEVQRLWTAMASLAGATS